MKSNASGWKSFAPLIVIAVLGLAVLIAAEPLSKWLASIRAGHGPLVVGHVVRTVGTVKRIHGSELEVIPSALNLPFDLHDGDRLQTDQESRAEVVLNSQDEFEIPESTELQLQLWNSKDPNSPIYIQSLIGALNFNKAGIRGRAYVVKEGRLYLPGQKPLQKPMALTVLKNAPLDLHLGTASSSAVAGSAFEPDTDLRAGDEPNDIGLPPSGGAEPDTLANEYIDDTIVSHQAQLQKCWLSRLKDSATLKGQIVMQFQISKRGKVKDVRIADSTLDDETLKKCVTSVFERLQFRSFKGAEISLAYPINFE